MPPQVPPVHPVASAGEVHEGLLHSGGGAGAAGVTALAADWTLLAADFAALVAAAPAFCSALGSGSGDSSKPCMHAASMCIAASNYAPMNLPPTHCCCILTAAMITTASPWAGYQFCQSSQDLRTSASPTQQTQGPPAKHAYM